MSYVWAFLVSYLYIAAKATQQLQVVNFQWARIMPMSWIMGFCEVFILATVARTADSIYGLFVLALCIGTGSGLGALTAMWRFKKRKA